MLTVGDNVGECFEGPGSNSKHGDRCFSKLIIRIKYQKNEENLGDGADCCQGPPQEGSLTSFDQKVKKNKISMILPVRVHPMGC